MMFLDPDSMGAYHLEQNIAHEWEYGEPGEYETSGRPSYSPPRKTCNRCRTGNLHWNKTEDGWRLFDARNEVHSCSKITEME